MLRFTCALTLLMLSTFTLAAEQKLAVIGGGDSGLNDLLTVRLSQTDGISVVERESDAVLDEKVVQGLMGTGANNDRKAAIAGADFLVLLSREDKGIQLVVAETRFGVTLESLLIPTDDQSAEKTAAVLGDQILAVVAEFSQGVRHVVAVSDFVSRDLMYDLSFLQSDYADVLRGAYGEIPGVAVIAIDDAKAIASEREISGVEQKERLVPIFIEGEYRTTRDTNSDETTVQITIHVKDGKNNLIDRELPAVPLEKAGKSLIEFFSKDLSVFTKTIGNGMNADDQYRLLDQRAAKFSSIGDFRRSAALREAALLLKPDDDEQRIQLVREYSRRNIGGAGWPLQERKKVTDAVWEAIVKKTIDDWKRSLHHCEYLIHNRLISREEATSLTSEAMSSIKRIGIGKSKPFIECEDLKKRFLRQSFSRIAYLDPIKTRRDFAGAVDVYNDIWKFTLVRRDRSYLSADDLDLIADLLLTDLPDSMLPSHVVVSFLRNFASKVDKRKHSSHYRFSGVQYEAFLSKLTASKRPLVRFYGRYGKACYRYYGKGEKSPELLKETEDIILAAQDFSFDKVNHRGGEFVSKLSDLMSDVFKDMHPTQQQPVWSREIASKKPARQTPKSRLTFEPIELTFDKAPEYKEAPSKTRFRSISGFSNISSYRPLTEGLDVFWAPGAVLFSHLPGKMTPVLVDGQLRVSDVIYDGRYVWVAGAKDWGMSVLDTDGRELAHIAKADGLPPCSSNGMVIHALGDGRMLASGCFGIDQGRAWIAEVSFDGNLAKVNVFHEAIKVMGPKDRNWQYNTDPHMRFYPNMMVEHIVVGEKPRRIIIITNGFNPLLVDPETHEVWGYPVPKGFLKKRFPRNDPPAEAFISIDGLLYVAGKGTNFRSYRLNDKTGLFEIVRSEFGSNVGDRRSGCLTRNGDWLYYVGSQNWRRLNLRTKQEELLIEDTRALPTSSNRTEWKVAVSSHYGLIASSGAKVYRLKINDVEKNASE